MNQGIARFLAIVFHPVFVNLLNLCLLFTLFPTLSHGIPAKAQLFYISFIFVATSIIPLLTVLVLRLIGKVNSILLNQKQERNIPYLTTMLLYFFVYFNFNKYPTHPLILSYIFACMAIVGSVMLINFYTKISIHLATLGALAGLLVVSGKLAEFDTRILLIITMLISGLVASARVFSNAHEERQVYSGFFLGFFWMLLIL